jgi:hypothetical protein
MGQSLVKMMLETASRSYQVGGNLNMGIYKNVNHIPLNGHYRLGVLTCKNGWTSQVLSPKDG